MDYVNFKGCVLTFSCFLVLNDVTRQKCKYLSIVFDTVGGSDEGVSGHCCNILKNEFHSKITFLKTYLSKKKKLYKKKHFKLQMCEKMQ